MDSSICTLKIATYNIWNDDAGQDRRAVQIRNEIENLGADLIALQEVTEHFFRTCLAVQTDFPFSRFCQYSGEDEGLAILSRYPIEESFFLQTSKDHAQSNALHVQIRVGSIRLSVTNLHLPWDSVRKRECQITEIDKYIHLQEAQEKADFYILLGDFNSSLNSSVHRFLLGEQTIDGEESNPYWDDLQSAYCARTGAAMTATLDFIRNPRWRGKEDGVCVPMAADRIYVMESFDTVRMKDFKIFGTEPSPETRMCASDHYGVAAQLEFEKEA